MWVKLCSSKDDREVYPDKKNDNILPNVRNVSAEAEVSETEAVLAEAASVEEWAEEVVPVHDSSQFTTPTKT